MEQHKVHQIGGDLHVLLLDRGGQTGLRRRARQPNDRLEGPRRDGQVLLRLFGAHIGVGGGDLLHRRLGQHGVHPVLRVVDELAQEVLGEHVAGTAISVRGFCAATAALPY